MLNILCVIVLYMWYSFKGIKWWSEFW